MQIIKTKAQEIIIDLDHPMNKFLMEKDQEINEEFVKEQITKNIWFSADNFGTLEEVSGEYFLNLRTNETYLLEDESDAYDILNQLTKQ